MIDLAAGERRRDTRILPRDRGLDDGLEQERGWARDRNRWRRAGEGKAEVEWTEERQQEEEQQEQQQQPC